MAEPTILHTCRQCDYQFHSKTNIFCHKEIVHKMSCLNLRSESTLANICSQCSQQFRKKPVLQNHIKNVHREGQSQPSFGFVANVSNRVDRNNLLRTMLKAFTKKQEVRLSQRNKFQRTLELEGSEFVHQSCQNTSNQNKY